MDGMVTTDKSRLLNILKKVYRAKTQSRRMILKQNLRAFSQGMALPAAWRSTIFQMPQIIFSS